MIEAGICLIERNEAQEDQKAPENEEEPEKFPGYFPSVRNSSLPRNTGQCMPSMQNGLLGEARSHAGTGCDYVIRVRYSLWYGYLPLRDHPC